MLDCVPLPVWFTGNHSWDSSTNRVLPVSCDSAEGTKSLCKALVSLSIRSGCGAAVHLGSETALTARPPMGVSAVKGLPGVAPACHTDLLFNLPPAANVGQQNCLSIDNRVTVTCQALKGRKCFDTCPVKHTAEC